MQIKRGSYRIVVLVGPLAFKLPLPSGSWKGRLHSFLQGWQQNITERMYSKLKEPYLCPVYFSFFGLVNVMPNCPILKPDDASLLRLFYENIKRECPYWYLVERKYESIGQYKGKAVAVDYGNDCIALQQDKMYRLAPLDAKGFDAIPEEEDHV